MAKECPTGQVYNANLKKCVKKKISRTSIVEKRAKKLRAAKEKKMTAKDRAAGMLISERGLAKTKRDISQKRSDISFQKKLQATKVQEKIYALPRKRKKR